MLVESRGRNRLSRDARFHMNVIDGGSMKKLLPQIIRIASLLGLITLDLTASGSTPPFNVQNDAWYYGGGASDNLSGYTGVSAVTNNYIWKSADNSATVNYAMTTGHQIVSVLNKTSQIVSGAMAYRAYTQSGPNIPANRPVTFIYNGGPGSSFSYLQSAYAPQAPVLTMPNQSTGPFTFTSNWFGNNPNSIINDTDLVFIDPIGTLYSTALAPATNQDFWNTDVDARSIAAFINSYLRATGRSNAPVYLMGESYGTPRSAITANILANQYAQIDLEGIVLISAILNGTNAINSMASMVPTLAANAYANGEVNWIGLGINPASPPSLQEYLTQVESYATSTILPFELKTHLPEIQSYLDSLLNVNEGRTNNAILTATQQSFLTNMTSGAFSSNGVLNTLELANQIVALQNKPPVNVAGAISDFQNLILNLNAAPSGTSVLAYPDDIKTRVAAYTGLQPAAVVSASAAKNAVMGSAYHNSSGQTLYLGEYDGRVTSTIAPDPNQFGGDDPASRVIDPIVNWGWSNLNTAGGYIPSPLNTTHTSNEALFALWDWTHVQPDNQTTYAETTLDAVKDLRSALTLKPNLRVYQGNGYFDSVTPYYGTALTYAQNFSDVQGQALMKRVTFESFGSGHMLYSTPAVGTAMKSQLDAFYSAN
jgi:carboxypeptidase C (cathepsin A)